MINESPTHLMFSGTASSVKQPRAREVKLSGGADILDEHPRKTGQSLHAVREMKPFWSAGLECYRWAEDTFLRKCHDDDDAGLFVGSV